MRVDRFIKAIDEQVKKDSKNGQFVTYEVRVSTQMWVSLASSGLARPMPNEPYKLKRNSTLFVEQPGLKDDQYLSFFSNVKTIEPEPEVVPEPAPKKEKTGALAGV